VDEEVNDEDEISSSLAWSRVLGCLRRSFGVGSHWAVVDIETVWEEYWDRVWGCLENRRESHGLVAEPAVDMLMGYGSGELGSAADSSVKCVPTLAGGKFVPGYVGWISNTDLSGSSISSLREFFAHAFIPAGPADQQIRLLSRTVGADRIVDEILFSCRHTAEIPWLLPGVSSTDQDIKVVVVVVAGFCAGKITRQSLYWDQASVLAQVGLIDRGLLPLAQGRQLS
jgi:predicted ester cyclase